MASHKIKSRAVARTKRRILRAIRRRRNVKY